MDKNLKITIYTIPGCPYCNASKEWLDSHNLIYKEISVPMDKSKREILDKFAKYFPDDRRGVPMIVIEKNDKEYFFNDETDPKLSKLIL